MSDDDWVERWKSVALALRAELAAANTRCAELESELKDADHRGASGCAHFVRANNLQATLDRVTALADRWEARKEEAHYYGYALDLRAALTPEGSE